MSNSDQPIVLLPCPFFVDERYAMRTFTPDWYRKHKPAKGGYLVIYKDGYESYSPAEAFEEGYTRV